jgi:transposase-like protein
VVVTCAFCGATHAGDEPPLTWTSAVENGKQRYFCEHCSRQHLRAIEGKLDSEWW